MALNTFVKISGITNLSDARYCAGMYVDLLGFSLEKSAPRFVDPTEFKEITGWVSGLNFVGEFQTYSETEILQTLENYPEIEWIEHVQIVPLIALKNKGLNLIYKLELETASALDEATIQAISDSEIIIHLTSNQTKLTAKDFETIKKLTGEFKVILGAGISADTVNQLVKELNLEGIALTGGDEIKPGLKDFDELADILEALEVEN